AVAQVGSNATILVSELLHRIERRALGVPGDRRIQPAAGNEEQWEAGAGFFVVDADVAFLVKWHGSLSLYRVACYVRSRIDQTREHLESSRHYSATEARLRLRRPAAL